MKLFGRKALLRDPARPALSRGGTAPQIGAWPRSCEAARVRVSGRVYGVSANRVSGDDVDTGTATHDNVRRVSEDKRSMTVLGRHIRRRGTAHTIIVGAGTIAIDQRLRLKPATTGDDALAGDWQVVGDDLRRAIGRVTRGPKAA